ncbi:MAG: class I poly(R)-hydroxyalkanoic acid synthase, partial [Pseudomonadota bacterium]|nr:class I poly(R)-hydroxyalkanoic acid synthase [Pseudomonadota bacterium]
AHDRRFRDPDWERNPFFDFLKQSYLITARWALDLVARADDVDEHTRHKARFYVEQIFNALSPTNFAVTNPQVLRLTLASNGRNLVDGLARLERDLEAGDGRLRITQTDAQAFELGRNVATTPGKVIYQNDVMQLIQYAPTTDKVAEIPLLIVPPWINKYYILDLNPKKSFIRWAVAQGHTVFVISWINPDAGHAHKTFGDYLRDGFVAACDAAKAATGAAKLNAIGYCVGGSLVAAGLARMAARNDDRINSVTFFATQVDFEKAGDLLVYVDEEQVRWIESRMADKGYLPGGRMADAFNLLRSNELIWSNMINNYLMGRDPTAFDLLFWNSDGTRMPANVHSFYLRECYLGNRLSKGLMIVDGQRLNLKDVKVPVYNLACRDDHIAPLASVFRVGKFLGGPTRLVVAGSGHIAGVVNPPEAKKYQHWTNDTDAATVEEWMAGAIEHAGSWWPDWAAWIGERSGKQVKARIIGAGKLAPLEDAPGSYVRVRGE